MSARVYLLLDVVNGKSEMVAKTLRLMPGVIQVDCLEGNPDVMVVVEASDRTRLAELLMSLLGKVDNAVEDLRLLVARDTEVAVPVVVHAG